MINLLAAAYGTISDIEIVWTIIALGGLVLSSYNAYESHCDKQILTEHGIRDGRWKIARYGMRAELARAFIQFTNLVIGLLAMTYPEPPPTTEPLKQVIFRFLFTWGFLSSAALLTLKSYWNFSLRRDLQSAPEDNSVGGGTSVEGEPDEEREDDDS